MALFLTAFLLVQAGVQNDLIELQRFLGGTYRSTIQLLDSQNQILLRTTEALAPAQAAQMRARMQVPGRLSADRPILSATINNAGQGLVTFLFEDDFIVEQVNFIFCPAQAGDQPRPERVLAIQVLFDDSRALGSAVNLLQSVYQLPRPLPPQADYQPALSYPVRPNLPLTIWNLGAVEVLYQPVIGQQLVTGQLWLTDKTVRSQCDNIPNLPNP